MTRYLFKRKSNPIKFSYFVPLAIVLAGSAILLEYVEEQEPPTSRIQNELIYLKDVSF